MYRFETLQLHAGQEPDAATGAVTAPIYQTNAYAYKSTQHAADLFALKENGHMYSRISNPTTEVLEKRVAALEGGVAAVAASSGHAAEVLTVLTLLSQGDHIVAGQMLYGGTYNLFSSTLPRYGITTSFVNSDEPEAFCRAIQKNTRLLYVETVGNPAINLTDIDAVAKIAHEAGLPLVVDNTFSTPYLYRPLEHGADLVIHSTTKYIGGHGAAMGGIVVDGGNFDWEASGKFPMLTQPDPGYHDIVYTKAFGKSAFAARARSSLMRDLGSCPSPMNSFYLLLGAETLSLRMQKHVDNARRLAAFLQKHPFVSWVNYPELDGNRYQWLAKRDFPRGVTGMFTFGIRGGAEAGARFIDSLRLFMNVSNLADSHSMVVHPASTTHAQMSPAEQLKAGVTPDMIRVSPGLEDAEDLTEDLDQAIRKAQVS